jgi:N6-L-threonylcarbamoyladenine synthase
MKSLIDIVLGIETSCDETSAAILQNNKVLANIVSSQYVHQQFGGVVPELASRAHIQLIIRIVKQALQEAHTTKNQLNGIAVTHGPGLVGALLVGLNFSKGLAFALNIPYIGINHIEGHIYGNFLSHPEIPFPHLCLVVSGGHTQLVLMDKHLSYHVLGKTRDDAVGEAFDKAAKLLGLGYPGGPAIDKLATTGNPDFHQFPRAYLKGINYDFSYSGLKTSLLLYCQQKDDQFVQQNLAHICASYQKAAVEVLVKKTLAAAKKYHAASVGLVGGVAANSLLRNWLSQVIKNEKIEIFMPDLHFCTDNAAMIARAGMQRLKAGQHALPDLNAFPALRIED